jgi:hypothetical protein
MAGHARQLPGGDQRAKVRCRIDAVAQAQRAGMMGHGSGEIIGHAALHEQARAGAAHLARIGKGRDHRHARGLVEIGIGKDDVGRFAAQFQADPLEAAGGRGHDRAAGGV